MSSALCRGKSLTVDLVARLRGLSRENLADALARLPDEAVVRLLTDLSSESITPQPHQQPPGGEWDAWVLSAGRGAGKSFASMFWLAQYADQHPGLRARIIAPTFGDAVASCVEGPNGLLRFTPEARFAASAPGGARVEFPNGSMVWVLGTPTPRDVDRLRALTNIDVDVFEEAAANPRLVEAFDQAKLSRRGTTAPRKWVATTTPRPLRIMRDWKQNPHVAYVQVASAANKHIDPAWLEELEKSYKGTRLYRQEVLGEILEDVEGALWTLGDLERSYVDPDTVVLTRFAVGVDPPATVGTCGIVVVGADDRGHVYVLADYSVTDATPRQWAEAVYQAHHEYEALVVAEVNQGGRMVTDVLHQEHPDMPVKTVHAAKGKQTRAEPVAMLWEPVEQIGHLAAPLDRLAGLVDQLATWDGSFSPDRLDALVWAVTHLRSSGPGKTVVAGGQVRRQLPGW